MFKINVFDLPKCTTVRDFWAPAGSPRNLAVMEREARSARERQALQAKQKQGEQQAQQEETEQLHQEQQCKSIERSLCVNDSKR